MDSESDGKLSLCPAHRGQAHTLKESATFYESSSDSSSDGDSDDEIDSKLET